jgi:hypothetical protein
VQLRIAGAREPIPKRRRQEARALQALVAAEPAARPARPTLEIAERRDDRRLVRDAPLGRRRAVAERMKQRHRLGRPERQIEARRARLALRQPIPGGGMLAGERLVQAVGVHSPVSPSAAAAEPTHSPGACAAVRALVLPRP